MVQLLQSKLAAREAACRPTTQKHGWVIVATFSTRLTIACEHSYGLK
jgi:hypothetical protein